MFQKWNVAADLFWLLQQFLYHIAKLGICVVYAKNIFHPVVLTTYVN